jgi:hypothetical protein
MATILERLKELTTARSQAEATSFADLTRRVEAGEELDPAGVADRLAGWGRTPADLERALADRAEKRRLIAAQAAARQAAADTADADRRMASLGREVSGFSGPRQRQARNLAAQNVRRRETPQPLSPPHLREGDTSPAGRRAAPYVTAARAKEAEATEAFRLADQAERAMYAWETDTMLGVPVIVGPADPAAVRRAEAERDRHLAAGRASAAEAMRQWALADAAAFEVLDSPAAG